MNDYFETCKLNTTGREIMAEITSLFNKLLTDLESLDPGYMDVESVKKKAISDIVKIRLTEACFFAKKSIAPKYAANG